MSDQQNNQNNRSKLTLKLKPVSVATSAPTREFVLKNTSNRRAGSAAVQVTIKGRKKTAEKAAEPTSILGLTKSEIEDRLASSVKATVSDEAPIVDAADVLRKITKKTRAEKAKEESAKEQVLSQEVEVKVEQKPEVKAEVAAKTVEKESAADIVKKAARTIDIADFITPSSDYSVDEFDVRNKIKKSVEKVNAEKEAREKVLSEKRKAEEQQKLEKEKLEREKKGKEKSKKPGDSRFADATEDSSVKKVQKTSEQKFNKAAFVKQIVSQGEDEDNSDDGKSFFRRRKFKQKAVSEQAKDYKKISREVLLPDLISVSDLAERMSEKAGDVVKKLFTMGMVATSNQVIDAETAEIIIGEFGHSCKRISETDAETNLREDDDSNSEKLPRSPVVTIMGHVDHGKTSLLDAIRSTDIVSGEHGGITQHIGASQVHMPSGKAITFLDTPGHEAFTEMRSRGANITDIVILVVAADDGVKEQTIEAISHAKAANVPIIVAVNKIDKPGADASRVKNELLSHEIVAEDMGGDVMFVEVSAKKKLNLDKLEEAILLQAEVLDLKAPYTGKASGVVIESRVDANKGVIATVLVQKGSLKVSDLVVVGTSYGRIRKMSDYTGHALDVATPSVPVEILGLDSAPSAGDELVEVAEERQAREIISYRSRKEKEEKIKKNASVRNVNDIFKIADGSGVKQLNIVIKGDVHGSIEAIQGSLLKLNTEEVAIKVVHIATGGISETDIGLAAVSKAIIIGFNVRASNIAKEKAAEKGVDIRYYSIIYNLVDDMKLLLSGMLDPTRSEEYLGSVEIRKIFKVSGAGKVAGCFVTSGMIKRGAKVRLLRDNVVIYDGALKILKRFKDDVKEVKSGFECGISLENYEDMKEGDTIECYEIVEEKRSL